jgi:hypothetical protein
LSSFSNINLINTSATSGGFVYISTTPQLLEIHNSNFSFAKVYSNFIYLYFLFLFFFYFYKVVYGGAICLNFTDELVNKDNVFVGDVFSSLEVWCCSLLLSGSVGNLGRSNLYISRHFN